MNENFMGPAQGMENQLQSIVQDAAASAANQRANRSAKAQEMQDMAKLIDWHLSTAADLYKTDKLASFHVYQGGMRLMGREVPSFEDYDGAKSLTDGAAEDYKNGNLGAMKFKLDYGQKLGKFTNTQDIARVSELQSKLQGAEAEKQAKAIADVQFPEHPQLARAREHVSMIDMVGGDLSRVQPDELVRLTGYTDRAAQQERLVHDRVIVEGQEAKQVLQKRMSQVFASDPAAYGKAAAITAASMTDPETMAKIDISDMVAKGENRTEDETKRMTAKIETWMPNTPLAAALGLKSAQRESELARAELQDTQTRMAELDEHLAVDGKAGMEITQLSSATEGLPSPDHPLSDAEAKPQVLAEGIRLANTEKYKIETAPRIKDLEQKAQAADQQQQQLASMLVTALPGQREVLVRKQKELEASSTANRALSRVLWDESEYAIADRKAELLLNYTPQGRMDLEKLEAAREKDLKVIETEQTRLRRRETMLQGRQTDAEKKAEEERNMNMAAQAAEVLIQKGGKVQTSIREAATQYKVDGNAVGKRVLGSLSTGIPEAQMDLLAAVQGFRTRNRREPTEGEKGELARQVLKNRPGLSPKDVMDVVKGEKPLVEVSMTDKASTEAAKDFIKSTRTTYDQLKSAPILLRNIDEAKALIPQAKGFMGPGGESLLEAAKFLNNRIGAKINTEGIKGAEELRTRIFFNIMENLKKMDAQPSQMQQQIMMDSLGKLGTDPNALAGILDAYGDTIRDKVDVFNQEVSGAMKQGTQFPYDPRIVMPGRKAMTGEPVIRSDAEYDALPPGTMFIGPDGKKRRKP